MAQNLELALAFTMAHAFTSTADPSGDGAQMAAAKPALVRNMIWCPIRQRAKCAKQIRVLYQLVLIKSERSLRAPAALVPTHQ